MYVYAKQAITFVTLKHNLIEYNFVTSKYNCLFPEKYCLCYMKIY